MSESLILQSVLFDQVPWQVHNCKLAKSHIGFDEPLLFLAQYDTLDEDIKAQNPLNKTLLSRLNDKVTVSQAAQILNLDDNLFKKSWQIKYIGRAVLFCESLQLALRFYFSNTAKPAQTVYTKTLDNALVSQADAWRAFGVVDVAYKGTLELVSQFDTTLVIDTPVFSPLPNTHSLQILATINEQKSSQIAVFTTLNEQIKTRVLALAQS